MTGENIHTMSSEKKSSGRAPNVDENLNQIPNANWFNMQLALCDLWDQGLRPLSFALDKDDKDTLWISYALTKDALHIIGSTIGILYGRSIASTKVKRVILVFLSSFTRFHHRAVEIKVTNITEFMENRISLDEFSQRTRVINLEPKNK